MEQACLINTAKLFLPIKIIVVVARYYQLQLDSVVSQ